MLFKERLQSDALLRGVLHVIPSAVAAQATAAAGADFVIIDREHGPIGRESAHAMIAATAGTDCAALVRVPRIDESEAKFALDSGADGIVFPLVRTAGDARRCVAAVTYPPEGTRGWGPFVAHAHHGTALPDHLAAMGSHAVCVVLLETVEAVEHTDAILAVPGIDLAIVAPFDLSTALGVHGRFDAPEFLEAVRILEESAARHGVPLGGAALTPETSRDLIGRGYRVLIQGIDVLMLSAQTAAFADWI